MSQQYPCAGIKVTVTKFVETNASTLLANSYSEAKLDLVSTADGNVVQDSGTLDITVYRRTVVDLAFAVESAIAGETYQPVGVSFFGQAGNVGVENFPTRTVTADVFGRLHLTVRDANISGGSFKFKLVIQREGDGALGVIDPHVNNGFE